MGTQKIAARCVIIGNGDIADYPAAAAMLCPEDRIVCADGGYRHCAALGVTPQLIIGDFDSFEIQFPTVAALPPEIALLRVPAEKDETDTALALRRALEDGFRSFLLLGLLGGRLDHTLGNLQLLAHCARVGAQALLTDGRTFAQALCAAPGRPAMLYLTRRAGYYFSLLAFSEQCEGVCITGAKYGLSNAVLHFDQPRAVSNEFAAGDAVITLASGTLLVIETPMDGPRPT